MKPLISILLLFCSFVSYSQVSINDTLINCGEYLILNNNFTFSYENHGCTSRTEGKGKYNIVDNIVTLNFEKIDLEESENMSCTFENNNCIHKDSICLQTNIINDNYETNSQSVIFIKDKNENLCWAAGFKQNHLLMLPKLNYINTEMYITLRGLRALSIPIFLNTCKKIKINYKGVDYRFDSFNIRVKDNSKLIYQINKIPNSGECFLLNNSGTITFTPLYEDIKTEW